MCPFKKAFPFAVLLHLVFVAGIFSAGASEEANHKAVFNLVAAQGQGEGMSLSVVRVGGEDSQTPAQSDSGDSDATSESSLRDCAAVLETHTIPTAELATKVTPDGTGAERGLSTTPTSSSPSQSASLARAKFAQSESTSFAPASGGVAGAKSSEEAFGGAAAGNGEGRLTPPIVISRPKPMRPEGVSQGEVVVTFIIDALGAVHSPEVVKSPSQEMASAVLKVLPRWRFIPAKSDGHAIALKVRQVIEF